MSYYTDHVDAAMRHIRFAREAFLSQHYDLLDADWFRDRFDIAQDLLDQLRTFEDLIKEEANNDSEDF